ncbi:MAG: D-glycero-beta-D-manno-heptose 1-phosphate adenylyltransferase [Alphaproteobacteria bacterium]|jgi:D-beta-D-heptose 7-phosphate kinase / D-beta-D-heptose 1-phosphate adenosyltransferase|nr:D-glycero-beta-D-manno-heptose 1-phosphate adenylyltransferase [Alphaproteobacteria bacterium]MBT4711153.1 D-glycero-beta-D-manno-heptose 1-phosphate adenylyltransferase [Alphaproteobacteria bacterium]
MSDPSDLSAILNAFTGVRVLVVGDVMLDRFVTGGIERISPDDSNPVVRVEREDAMAGGAANVACNIASLGARADLIGVVGDDDAASRLKAMMFDAIRVTARFVTESGRATTEKIRVFGDGRQIVRTDRESRTPLAETTVRATMSGLKSVVGDADAVMVSDYAKGVVTADLWAQVVDWAKASGKPVIVDPKGADFSAYRGATVLTPNARELAMATGAPVATDTEVETAALDVMKSASIGAMVVTRGRDGLSIISGSNAAVHIGTLARDAVDVSGAGDTVAAALACALASGAELVDAAQLANAAAGVVVSKVGTATPHASEVLAALSGTDVKITTLIPALERIQHWRDQGQSVAFTNGCFDLVHPGHVSLLNQARAAADRLVVGLNTDASVRGLKGEGRPIQNETARAAVLASMGAVDMVIPFAEETPMGLIESIRPDVLVKGADYTVDQVVGGAFVESYGGRIVLAELAPGESSTGLVSRIGDLNRQAGE